MMDYMSKKYFQNMVESNMTFEKMEKKFQDLIDKIPFKESD